LISSSALLGNLVAILQPHPCCEKVIAIETREFSPDQYMIKIRADLKTGKKFQVRLYCNHGHIDYAYQLFSDVPLLRWDNKEEFCSISTYPHHHHDEMGNIKPSPLVGDPIADLKVVLAETE